MKKAYLSLWEAQTYTYKNEESRIFLGKSLFVGQISVFLLTTVTSTDQVVKFLCLRM